MIRVVLLLDMVTRVVNGSEAGVVADEYGGKDIVPYHGKRRNNKTVPATSVAHGHWVGRCP